MNDENEDMNVRIRAAGYLLQLGWGDAPKEATLRLVSDDRTGAELSSAELLAIALGKAVPPVPVVVDAEVATDAAAD